MAQDFVDRAGFDRRAGAGHRTRLGRCAAWAVRPAGRGKPGEALLRFAAGEGRGRRSAGVPAGVRRRRAPDRRLQDESPEVRRKRPWRWPGRADSARSRAPSRDGRPRLAHTAGRARLVDQLDGDGVSVRRFGAARRAGRAGRNVAQLVVSRACHRPPLEVLALRTVQPARRADRVRDGAGLRALGVLGGRRGDRGDSGGPRRRAAHHPDDRPMVRAGIRSLGRLRDEAGVQNPDPLP